MSHIKLKHEYLRQSNSLTTAAYSLSKPEKRIVYIAIKQCLESSIEFESLPWGQVTVDIKIDEYKKLFSTDNASREIAAAAKSMAKREVVFFTPNEDHGEDKAHDAMSWVVGRSHRPKRGLTTFYFNAKLMKEILAIKSDFTKYLIDSGNLSSSYSMRLYESLMQWDSKKKLTVSVNWIIERYELPESYKRMSDFRRRFLNPAIKDINANTDIVNLTVEEEKRGASTHLTFSWAQSSRNDKSSKNEKAELTPLELATVTYCKINNDEVITSEELANLALHIMSLHINDGFEVTDKIKAALKDKS